MSRSIRRSLPSFLESLERRVMLSGESDPRAFFWIEGENYSSSTFNRHPWYTATSLTRDLMSPGVPGGALGAWHAHYVNSGSTSATARYNFTVAQPGDYQWWIRLNPYQGKYSYRVNNAAFATLDTSDVASARDLVDPGIDIRFLGWKYVGQFTLSAGANFVEVRISGSGETHGAIDVMALTNWDWAPSGHLPPQISPPTPAPDAWFPLAIGPDRFSSESVIDMSHLLDDTAGEHGPLMRDGENFRFADGTPVKFWAIGAAPDSANDAYMQRQARFYAKHGINMVRLHPVEEFLGPLQGPASARFLDPVKLDHLDRWFKILKDQGIYSTWSIFYHNIVRSDDGIPAGLYNELPNLGAGKDTYGYATFVQEYREKQWQYANLLLNHVNPYTGLAYKNDPALAVVETRNEDSVFFHHPLTSVWNGRDTTLVNHAARMRQMFGTWVKARYGTEANLTAAWGTWRRPVDNWAAGVFDIMGAFHLGPTGPLFEYAGQTARAGDFMRFLAETQKADYALYYSRLRGIGYQGVIVSTAWQSGGLGSDAANLWTDDAMDAIDRHAYFGGGAGDWQITTGSVNNDNHLRQPFRGIPNFGRYQVENKPFIATEWNSNPPNQWRAEITPIMALYGLGLQGWDASYQFTGSRSYMGNGWSDMSSYVSETPLYMGQFPALSLAIHRGDFAEGAVAAAQRIRTDDVFRGLDVFTRTYPGGGFNPGAPSGSFNVQPEVMAIGKLVTQFGDNPPASEKIDWTQYWNTSTQRITSTTGQLVWDYGKKIIEARSPRTQGVIGFAGTRSFNLPGVNVSVTTPFVSLLFSSLDGLPIDQSERILVTALARDQQFAAQYNADGSQLLFAGGEPLMLEPVRATITVLGDAIDAVHPLDVYGVPLPIDLPLSGNTFAIDGTYATYYYEIRRSIPAPEVTSAEFAFETRQSVVFRFSKDVGASLSAADLVLANASTGLPVNGAAVEWDAATLTATFSFPGQILPDGDYLATLPAGSVLDAFGKPLAADESFGFFVLAGDANRDRVVDVADLGIVATHWQQSERTFGQGDFNYDRVVDVADLGILATKWQQGVPAAPSLAGAPTRFDPAGTRAVALIGMKFSERPVKARAERMVRGVMR